MAMLLPSRREKDGRIPVLIFSPFYPNIIPLLGTSNMQCIITKEDDEFKCVYSRGLIPPFGGNSLDAYLPYESERGACELYHEHLLYFLNREIK